MKRLIAAAVFFSFLPYAHGFFDALEGGQLAEALGNHFDPPPKCQYSFGWGRNTVSITYEGAEASPIDCTFTHSERVSKNSGSSNLINAIYFQHYTCVDGSRAAYSTNWIGSSFSFVHYPAGEDRLNYCD